jgi:hypothetical protein
MTDEQRNHDRQYLTFVSRRLKQIANKTDDDELKSKLWGYSKEILDISSRMITKDEFIGAIIRS